MLEDLTGGFNYGAGAVELQCPPRSAIQPLGGHRMHWLRCRIDDKTRHGGAATTYTQAPEIYSITAAPIGALLPDVARQRSIENEILGDLRRHARPDVPRCATRPCSSPRRARRSRSRTRSRATGPRGSCAPTSSPRPRSTATTRSTPSAARSTSGRRSARPTAAGPSTARSRPRAPCCASRATATAAGATGTSRPARSRRCARRSSGVDTVVNPGPANGGVDAEALEHARQRAAMEIRSRYRAVTAEDFEFLAGEGVAARRARGLRARRRRPAARSRCTSCRG